MKTKKKKKFLGEFVETSNLILQPILFVVT